MFAEALLFASSEPVSYQKISKFLGKLTKAEVAEVIERLNEKYTEGGHVFRIREIAEGYQFCLQPNMTSAVEKFLKRQRERRLTQAGLETLAVIAYKQPVTKGEIEHIRGVGADGTLNTLLERKLVTIVGRSEKVGHPLLYGTTKTFLEYFGLKDIKELPRLEEFAEAYKPKKGTSQQELLLDREKADEDIEEDDDTVPAKTKLKFVLGHPEEEEPEEEDSREELDREGDRVPVERDDEA